VRKEEKKKEKGEEKEKGCCPASHERAGKREREGAVSNAAQSKPREREGEKEGERGRKE
jgi:hypothetical protein